MYTTRRDRDVQRKEVEINITPAALCTKADLVRLDGSVGDFSRHHPPVVCTERYPCPQRGTTARR